MQDLVLVLVKTSVSRRAFLQRSMLLASGTLLAACTQAAPTAPLPAPTAAPAAATTAPAPAPPKPTTAPVPAAQPTQAPATVRATKTLTFAQEAFPPSMDPLKGQQLIQGKRISHALYDRPVIFDANMAPVPQLATEWKAIDDTTWQFKLRQDVKFHDGTPLDAEAVKMAIELVANPETKNTYSVYAGPISGASAVDKYTLNVKTTDPFPLVPIGLSMTAEVVPPSAYKDWNSFIQKPIGSGAFRFVEFRANDRIVLEANSDYFGGRPKIDQLIIRYIPDAATRAAALKAGEVQLASGLPIDTAKDIEASGNKAMSILLTRGLSIDFNETIDHPINKDVRVRQGLNYAIDKESINKDFLLGFGAVMDAQIPQKGTFGYNPDLKPYPYDAEKAKSLFAEAGFPNGFELEIFTQPAFGHQDIATIAAAQLSKVGVKSKATVMEAGVYANAKQETKLGPAFTSTWASFGDASQNLVWFTSASTIGKYHVHPDWDELILGANKTVDQTKREQMFHQVTALMRESPPCVWTVRMPEIWGVAKNVVNPDVNSVGFVLFYKTDLA
jgi:peptide/nickel transport system substrate-binding protein